MSERLRQFMLDVSKDLDRAKRLTADPVAELDQSDLSPDEKQIVLTRDPDVVRQAMGADRSEILAVNSFFKLPSEKPEPPAKPAKPRPRKPSRRKPARKAPAKKRATKRTAARKGASRKTARKATRKSARKGSRGRR